MSVNAKKLAFLSLLLSFDVLLIILSGILEFNTLFLLAAASFCVGIAIRESSKQLGFGFYLGSILLSLLLAPNKLYCITYAAMGLYIVVIEFAFDKLIRIRDIRYRRKDFWLIKYIVFNLMLIPMLLLMPKLIYEGDLNLRILGVLCSAAQILLFIYDKAYEYFQSTVWNKIRKYMRLI